MLMRPACDADVRALAALDRSCFAFDAWSAQSIRESLNLPTTRSYVLDDEGTIAAFALVQFLGPEAEILTIATKPAYRRQGLARRVIRKILRDQKEGTVFLEVAADNEGAIALYEACGFTLMGRRKGYYKREKGRMDALTYCLNVEKSKG